MIHIGMRLCYGLGMAQTLCPIVSADDRARLEAVVADRNRPQKHVARARIVLFSAQRLDVAAVARRAGISRPAVWRWQRRFAEAGVDGLLRDRTRKPGKPALGEAVAHRVVALTCAEPPGEATHWTGRAMAKAAGLSLRSVQRIWAAHQLQPHRLRTFKRSRDPAFAAKLEAIVGLYMAPPRHAVVLSVDESWAVQRTNQIQALDRTHHAQQADDPTAEQRQPQGCRGPGLPIKPGKCGTMTHDYVRHGTTTLFAALNVLDGTVLGRCPTGPDEAGPVASGTGSTAVPSMARHRHQEFLRFLNTIEAAVPAGKLIHCILDNYGTHKHAKVNAWLDRHPRWTWDCPGLVDG